MGGVIEVVDHDSKEVVETVVLDYLYAGGSRVPCNRVLGHGARCSNGRFCTECMEAIRGSRDNLGLETRYWKEKGLKSV